MKALIDEMGRVALPDFVRTQLGVKPGDALSLDEHEGKWFLRPIARSASTGTGSENVMYPSVHGSADTRAAADDDLHWEEPEYSPVPMRSAGQISVRMSRAGRAKPMLHEMDDE